MLLPSDLGYFDNEIIAKMSGQGWYPWDHKTQLEDLLSSREIVIKAIEKAQKSTNS
jgi:hypothetical protein